MKIDPWGLAFGVAALIAGSMLLKQERAPTSVSTAALAPAALCERDITKFVPFKDPSSVQVLSTRAEPRAGQFTLFVRAKNSFGAYGDTTACSCGVASGAVTDMHCDSASGI